ncbi:bridging integrator 2a [Thalassophryne amazonica]|uniref:bridging integrator 2a n=1 Tax=Thalassophryne amazonica TaxID=390379 RepID=UPI0014715F24|nr:bridging integrator 2a [Thalassophryne amazonica]
MAESTSPKGTSGDFAKKVQRQLSRSKEKVLQKLGKAVETRDEQFDLCLLLFNDQQTDGNRIYKDLKNYLSAVREMQEASRRLSQSLFDAYESSWAGEEDLGAIVEGEDLLWNDYEVKLLDQAVRTMESYVDQFPDVREKVAKRGRKLVDYDSSRHHLDAVKNAKKRDDININKAEEEVKAARRVYESINRELKEELPVLYESRIGCYVTVFSAVSNLRDIFFQEMCKLNHDLHCVIKELQAQHPGTVFAVKGLQRYGSLRRRTLLSPKSWKGSFSDFHRNYSLRASYRFNFRSPEKPRHRTLSRESSSSLVVSPPSRPLEGSSSELRDPESPSSQSKIQSSAAEEETAAAGTAEEDVKSGEESNQVEEEKSLKEGEAEPEPPAGSDLKGDCEKEPPSESSSELSNSCDSESLELQLSGVNGGTLHIEERDDGPAAPDSPEPKALENGEVSASNKNNSVLHTNAVAEKCPPVDSKSTDV